MIATGADGTVSACRSKTPAEYLSIQIIDHPDLANVIYRSSASKQFGIDSFCPVLDIVGSIYVERKLAR